MAQYRKKMVKGLTSMTHKRGNVWLGVCGIVINDIGQWLVVEKTYSGLKGLWSLPAGFVQQGETIDEAMVREVKEETGIDAQVRGLVAFRSGVIMDEISDNMAILYAQAKTFDIVVQEKELRTATWLSPEEIAASSKSSVLLKELAQTHLTSNFLPIVDGLNPGEVFSYTAYKLFLHEN